MITQELWMDLKLLSRQGMSIRAIARATGLSRNTVRRALAAKTPPDYKPRRAKPQKIAPYLDYLQAQLEQRPWVSAAQIYREISPQGYGGCYELVKVQWRSLRQQQQAARRACVRFETAPAQEAQFDWKGPVSGLLASAPNRKLYFFRLVLGYSRYRITRLVTLQTLPAVLADLMDVLAILGGLPQRLVFDNFGAAVLKPRPNLRLHPFFADFCDHYGIEPAPALPYSPQRKGKTERSFRDLAESDLLHQVYADPVEIQWALDRADEQYNLRLHTTTGETPLARLERERPFLLPLPALPFDPRLPETRRVLSDCTISYHAAYYCVPHQLVGKRLTVKSDPRTGQIEIFDGADAVATHQQAAKGQRVIVEEHIAELRRPRWDRLRRAGSPATRAASSAQSAAPQLVAWPQVPVASRPIADYVNLIEEVAQ
ncbi:MAG: IS21 family transposase [Parvibaculum sp.]|nr:IS21 family transposase [Parvibaculum sp.]